MIAVISGGVTYSLDDGSLCWFQGMDGAGLPDLRRFGEQGPMQHGESERGFRLQARTLRLKLAIQAGSLSDYFARRERLLALFHPEQEAHLRLTLPGGAVRQLDVAVGECALGLESNWRMQRVALDLRAADPTYYDPAAETITLLPEVGSGPYGEVPMSVPHGVGAPAIDETITIQYQGTWISYPRIRLSGPLSDPLIEHGETGEKLDFSGTTIAAGDWYEIDLRYGYKTVRDAGGVERSGRLSDDSDLATFHLDRRLPGEAQHANPIRVTGSGAGTATRVDVTFLHRYIGL